MKILWMIFSVKKRFEDELSVQYEKNGWTLKYKLKVHFVHIMAKIKFTFSK